MPLVDARRPCCLATVIVYGILEHVVGFPHSCVYALFFRARSLVADSAARPDLTAARPDLTAARPDLTTARSDLPAVRSNDHRVRVSGRHSCAGEWLEARP